MIADTQIGQTQLQIKRTINQVISQTLNQTLHPQVINQLISRSTNRLRIQHYQELEEFQVTTECDQELEEFHVTTECDQSINQSIQQLHTTQSAVCLNIHRSVNTVSAQQVTRASSIVLAPD